MYEVKISKDKVIDIMDFSEVYGILNKKTIEKDEFYDKIAKEIENVYDAIIFKGKDKNENKNKIIFIALKGEMLIDKSYNFLINGKGEFIEYYDLISIDENRVINMINGEADYIYGEESPICMNLEEIRKKYNSFEEDEMGTFYYSAFTKFYLESYLIQSFSMFVDLYKSGSWRLEEVIKLHEYLVNIFTNDFSEAFRRFELKIINREPFIIS
jgi:hypothetical protein